jgi:hypothetical protein
MNATAKRAAAQASRMKISQWLKDRVGSHDICNFQGVARDFKQYTGVEPPFQATMNVGQARAKIKRRGLGGYCEGREEEAVIAGYEIAVILAKHFVSQFRSTKMGRGSMFWEAHAALEAAGL